MKSKLEKFLNVRSLLSELFHPWLVLWVLIWIVRYEQLLCCGTQNEIHLKIGGQEVISWTNVYE